MNAERRQKNTRIVKRSMDINCPGPVSSRVRGPPFFLSFPVTVSPADSVSGGENACACHRLFRCSRDPHDPAGGDRLGRAEFPALETTDAEVRPDRFSLVSAM